MEMWIATVVDSLKAIKKYIFDERAYSAQEFQKAVQNNFIGFEKLRWTLKNQTEKWGNNEEEVDQIAVKILDMFAEACKGKKQNLGGGLRPGTGSAQLYVQISKKTGATPIEHLAGKWIPANSSPSINVKLKGPLFDNSIIY